MWPQKCDGGPYNGADSVSLVVVYKQQNDCIPALDDPTLLKSSVFLTLLGIYHQGAAEVLNFMLEASIILLYTYKMRIE